MMKPLIRLWHFNGVGVIISYPSGVIYSNQTGGYSCLQPELEGVFASLDDSLMGQQAQLNGFFTGSKWRGGCANGIDEETADFIDSVLNAFYYSKHIKVDRSKMSESHESWIHVVFLAGIGGADLDEMYGFDYATGVVTWPNSD